MPVVPGLRRPVRDPRCVEACLFVCLCDTGYYGIHLVHFPSQDCVFRMRAAAGHQWRVDVALPMQFVTQSLPLQSAPTVA